MSEDTRASRFAEIVRKRFDEWWHDHVKNVADWPEMDTGHRYWVAYFAGARLKLADTQLERPADLAASEQSIASLNKTLSEMIEYRFRLRQATEQLLQYAKDHFPRDPSSSSRELEEGDRRREIITNAEQVLHNTAIGAAGHTPLPTMERPAEEWISVEERLPELGMRVLAWKPNPCIEEIVEFTQHSKWHLEFTRRDKQWWDHGSQITHWRPLPQPPKSGRGTGV